MYRRIFGFHKWESVKSFIDGLGRLDLKHLVMTYKVRFYKKLAYGANSVMSDLYYVHLMDTDYQARRNVFVSGGGYKFVRTLYSLVVKVVCSKF